MLLVATNLEVREWVEGRASGPVYCSDCYGEVLHLGKHTNGVAIREFEYMCTICERNVRAVYAIHPDYSMKNALPYRALLVERPTVRARA